MSLFFNNSQHNQLDRLSIRIDEVEEILEIIESAKYETVDEVSNMIRRIWDSHYSEYVKIECEIDTDIRRK